MGRVSQGFDLVGACRRQRPKHAGVCSLRKRRLPRRISRPYGQCRRAARESLSLGEAVAGVVAELGKEEEEAVVVAVVMQMV